MLKSNLTTNDSSFSYLPENTSTNKHNIIEGMFDRDTISQKSVDFYTSFINNEELKNNEAILKDQFLKTIEYEDLIDTTFLLKILKKLNKEHEKEIFLLISETIENYTNRLLELIYNQKTVLKKLHDTLDNLHKECEEEDFPVFDEIARTNAKKILEFIYSEFPDKEYHIYPTEDRKIAICYNPQRGKRILMLCDSKGSIACFVIFKDKSWRFRHNSLEKLFYKNLHEAFKELNKKNHSQKNDSSQSAPSFQISTYTIKKDVENKQAIYSLF